MRDRNGRRSKICCTWFTSPKWTDDIQQLKQERDSFRKQRDELINDMAEIKRKAEAFDEILDINIDKDELLSEEYIEKVNDVIQEWKFS